MISTTGQFVEELSCFPPLENELDLRNHHASGIPP
jgi:hypothetical protein